MDEGRSDKSEERENDIDSNDEEEQVTVAETEESIPKNTSDMDNKNTDSTDDSNFSYSPGQDSENDADSSDEKEESKTVITVMDEFENDDYGVTDNPNSHQHLDSQMMMRAIEDLPNEIINIIFHYLDESDVIHMGLAYKRLARFQVQGDRIGSKILCIWDRDSH